jgi:hypothetical protein
MIGAMIKAMIKANLRGRSGHRVAPCRTLAGDAEKAGGAERLGGIERLAGVLGLAVGLAVDREDAD